MSNSQLSCLLEKAEKRAFAQRGLPGPAIAVITGMRKKIGTVFSERYYAEVRQLGKDHTMQAPWHIANQTGLHAQGSAAVSPADNRSLSLVESDAHWHPIEIRVRQGTNARL